jgi:hypothetical protein
VDRYLTRPLTREQARSLWLHRALLGPLLADPEGVRDRACRNVATALLAHRRDGMASQYLNQWQELLEGRLDDLVDTMTSPAPAACELRQNTPFAGVLEEELR